MTDISKYLDNHMTIDAMYNEIVNKNKKTWRNYLGASEIGSPCWRMLFFRFRQVSSDIMTIQSILSIEDGYRQEDIAIDRLRLVKGIELENKDKNKEQFGFKLLGGHFCGHIDGKIKGIFEAPETEHILEIKSVNEKKFKQLRNLILDVGEKDALEKWDAVYYAQAIIYCHTFGLDRHITIVSSPGGRNYTSCRTNYNGKVALSILTKAESIITSDRPPVRISDNRSFYLCGWCRMKEICFDLLVPEVNCRTCAFSEPDITGSDAVWHCHKKNIDFTGNPETCDLHLFLNTLVPFPAVDADSSGETPSWIKYQVDKDIFYNVNVQAKKLKNALNLTSLQIKEKEYFECIFPDPKNEKLKENKKDREITKKLSGII